MEEMGRAKMKFVNRMKFVLDMIGDRGKLFVLVVLMGVISFCLVDLCLMYVVEQRKTYLQADALFSTKKEDVYKLSNADLASIMDFAEENTFEKALADSELWNQLCRFSIQSVGAFDALKNSLQYQDMMEKGYVGTLDEEMMKAMGQIPGDFMNVCAMNEKARTLFGIRLPQSIQPQAENDDQMIPVYAGSRLQGILQPGQVLGEFYLSLEAISNPEEILPVTCYVAGFLEESTLVLSDSYLGGSDIASNLDTMIFICTEDVQKAGYIFTTDMFMDNLYAVLSEEEELVSFRKEAKLLFEAHNRKVNIRSIPDLIRDNSTFAQSYQVLIMLAVFLTLSGFLAFATTSVISVLLNQRKFGIMLANGVSHKDLNVMLFLETGIKYSLSLLIAFCFMQIMYVGSKDYVYTGIDYQMSYQHMHWHYVLPLLFGLSVFGVLLSTIVPVRIVRRLNLMELLRQD